MRRAWLLATLAVLLLPAAAADPMLVAVAPSLPGGTEGLAVGSDEAWDLAGWSVTDGEGTLRLPTRSLAAGQALWLTRDATAWAVLQGPPASPWQATGAFQLANGGEGLVLVDPQGRAADAFAWGDGHQAGFAGGIARTSEGLVYQRDEGWPDTDHARDWATPRLHRIGESALAPAHFLADRLTLYASPDSSHEVLSGLIASARTRLHLHVYEFTSLDLAQRLAAAKASQPALDLRVLVDSSPVGLTASERHREAQALLAIQEAGGNVTLSGHGRYAYHHLKVLVADGAVAVQSENWVDSGVPRDPSWGNRGWGVVVHDPLAADWFAGWMGRDRLAWDARPFDLQAFDPLFTPVSDGAPRIGTYGPRTPPLDVHGAFRVTALVAPDHTQDPRRDPVASLVGNATRQVDVQQLDVSLQATNPLGWASADPLADALGQAARRGVRVRVQAAAPFAEEDTGNAEALAAFAAQGVETSVLARPGVATLHNKGLIVDDAAVVVGSMNGNHHSRSANREVSLIVEGPGVAAWFRALFEADLAGATRGPDASVIGKDVRALPWAPLPSLLALAGVAAALRVRP